RGAFSEGAAWALAPGLRAEPRRSFPEVVRSVEAGQDQAGVLPVENTLAGGVTAALDALVQGDVRAIAEVVLPIRHALLGVDGADRSEVVEVRSHPVALAQCRRFFDEHPGIEPVAVRDTAGAARRVAELGDPSIAALAGRHAGDTYGLTVLADDLQDRDDNQTRFLLLVASGQNEPVVRHAMTPLGRTRWKTGLSVETRNRPGELRDLLTVFADRGLDLTFILSRPTGTPWTYRFILEFCHGTLEEGETCVEAAGVSGRMVRVLGTYGAVETPAP
ncbi:MAG: prephenate dehydratase domain-containing protein, partial [Longimicrobiales bacterium]|nr:prephenate dehydratase domain-containing protein [Longimicrobiales bacterium]